MTSPNDDAMRDRLLRAIFDPSASPEVLDAILMEPAARAIVRSPNLYGMTILHAAVPLEGDDDLVRAKVGALIRAGADVNAAGGLAAGATDVTPLHIAAIESAVVAAEELLAHGASTEARTAEGDTPLLLCIRWFDVEVARMLIRAGADRTARNRRGQTPEECCQRKLSEIDLLEGEQDDSLRAHDFLFKSRVGEMLEALAAER